MLQPEESLTIRVSKPGEGDKQVQSVETVRHDGAAELIVRMDEKVKGEAVFTVNGQKIDASKVKRSADGVTFHITLDKVPAQGEKLKVKVSGITDMAGNAIAGDTASVDFHKAARGRFPLSVPPDHLHQEARLQRLPGLQDRFLRVLPG